jgi:hypothetical protein
MPTVFLILLSLAAWICGAADENPAAVSVPSIQ